MQEDKEGLLDALDTWHDCLDMAQLVLEDLKVNEPVTKAAAMGGYSNATELADYLVAKGIPFREAHHIVGPSRTASWFSRPTLRRKPGPATSPATASPACAGWPPGGAATTAMPTSGRRWSSPSPGLRRRPAGARPAGLGGFSTPPVPGLLARIE